MQTIYLIVSSLVLDYVKEYLDIYVEKYKFEYFLFNDKNGEVINIESESCFNKDNIYIYVTPRDFSINITNKFKNIGLLNTESYDRHLTQYGSRSIENLVKNKKISFLIEYSEENIINLKKIDIFKNIKIYFLPSTILKKEIFLFKKHDLITTLNFLPVFPRRKKILDKLIEYNLPVQNINMFGINRDNIIMK